MRSLEAEIENIIYWPSNKGAKKKIIISQLLFFDVSSSGAHVSFHILANPNPSHLLYMVSP